MLSIPQEVMKLTAVVHLKEYTVFWGYCPVFPSVIEGSARRFPAAFFLIMLLYFQGCFPPSLIGRGGLYFTAQKAI